MPHLIRLDPSWLDGAMSLVGRVVEGMQLDGIDQWDEAYPDRQVITEDLARGALVGAMGESGLVAMVTLDDRQSPAWEGVRWRLAPTRIRAVHRLMVDPTMQRRGLARWLMGVAEGLVLADGGGAVRLDAFTGNPRACAMYDALGYSFVGTVTLRKGPFRCYEKGVGALPAASLPVPAGS